jgi:tetratricopeptide (TPR) repeat protein
MHFRAIAALQPHSPAALINLAWSLAIAGGERNLELARSYCEKALSIEPASARADACLGVIAFQLNERTAAERHLSHVVEQQPNDVESAVNLASLKARMGAYPEAEELLNKVLAAHPLHLRANAELSQLALKLERSSEARMAAQKAMDAHPTSAAGFRAMAATFTAENQYSRAEGVLRDALATVDADELDVIRLDHAVVLLRLGDEMKSDTKYQEALDQILLTTQDGGTPEGHLLRGLAELKLKNPKGALRSLSRVGRRRDLVPYVEEYTTAARRQLESESTQIGALGKLAAALIVLQTGVLWGAFFAGKIQATELAVLLPIFLGLLIVSAVLPHLTKLKVATVEADISRAVRDFQFENLSGPRLRLDLPPEASLVVTAKTLDV